MKNVNEKRKRTPESVVIVLYLRIINIYNEDNNFQKYKQYINIYHDKQSPSCASKYVKTMHVKSQYTHVDLKVLYNMTQRERCEWND